jgi:hypothetical protein
VIPAGIVGSAHRDPPPSLNLTFRSAPNSIEPANDPKTAAAVPIGTPVTNRTVVVIVSWWAGGARDVNGVTIGGITATMDYSTGSTTNGFSVWRAVVPTGTTANIVVDCTDNTPDISLGVWTTGIALLVESSASTQIAVGQTTGSVTAPSTVNGGFVVCGFSARSNAMSTTFTNLTERYDSADAQPAAGGDAITAGGSHQVDVTFSTATTNDPTRLGIVAYKAA